YITATKLDSQDEFLTKFVQQSPVYLEQELEVRTRPSLLRWVLRQLECSEQRDRHLCLVQSFLILDPEPVDQDISALVVVTVTADVSRHFYFVTVDLLYLLKSLLRSSDALTDPFSRSLNSDADRMSSSRPSILKLPSALARIFRDVIVSDLRPVLSPLTPALAVFIICLSCHIAHLSLWSVCNHPFSPVRRMWLKLASVLGTMICAISGQRLSR
ncbi:hypothetical protein, partial [Paracoccus fontiphilus]